MFGSRRGRPSLIDAAARTAGRTAVVVGTANAMSRPRRAGEAPVLPRQPLRRLQSLPPAVSTTMPSAGSSSSPNFTPPVC